MTGVQTCALPIYFFSYAGGVYHHVTGALAGGHCVLVIGYSEAVNDPAFYDRMSELLDEIIRDRRAKAIEYEEYLRRINEVATRVQSGKAEDSPQSLNTPGKTALYNNLAQNEELALRIDAAVKRGRPDSWRGIRARENIVKGLLHDILQDQDQVEDIFRIVRAQPEYR